MEGLGTGLWIYREVTVKGAVGRFLDTYLVLRHVDGRQVGAAPGWDAWRLGDGRFFAKAQDEVLHEDSSWAPFRAFLPFAALLEWHELDRAPVAPCSTPDISFYSLYELAWQPELIVALLPESEVDGFCEALAHVAYFSWTASPSYSDAAFSSWIWTFLGEQYPSAEDRKRIAGPWAPDFYPASLRMTSDFLYYPRLSEWLPAQEFLADASLRPLPEILDEADFIARCHGAVAQALINRKMPPGGLKVSVVRERHAALYWLLGNENHPWDVVADGA